MRRNGFGLVAAPDASSLSEPLEWGLAGDIVYSLTMRLGTRCMATACWWILRRWSGWSG